MIESLAFIFACAFGFALAFWIAATLLNNSNNYGDYHADASRYSASVHFTSDERLKNSNSRGSYVGMGVFKKPTAALAPKGKELIQKPTASRVHPSDQDAASSNTPLPKAQTPSSAPASTPKGRDPSAFPRSFHDV
jgi:hypothetical protein